MKNDNPDSVFRCFMSDGEKKEFQRNFVEKQFREQFTPSGPQEQAKAYAAKAKAIWDPIVDA